MVKLLRNPILNLLLLLLVVAVGSYIIFGLGDTDSAPRTSQTQLIATADFDREPRPVEPFAALDPGVARALLNQDPFTQPSGLPMVVPGIPSIGVYVPAQAAVFEILPPTPLPLPDTNIDQQITINTDNRSGVVNVDLTEGCAPEGAPVGGILTQRFHRYHAGIDLGIPLGTPVKATQSGEVLFAGWSSIGYGYVVIIESGQFITYYAHNSNLNVKAGEVVATGSIIAWSGSTGNSTGPHVHYEVRINDVPVDPLSFDQRGYEYC